jgi:hypothetical protein
MSDSDNHLERISIATLVLAAAILSVPAHAQEQTRLEVPSEEHSFLIEIMWTANDLEDDHIFGLTFIEPVTGSELEDIQYDFLVMDGDGVQILRRVDQVSTEQSVGFDDVGAYTIVIEDIEGLGEDASFAIEVTPEFPVSALIPAVIGTVIVIAAVRSKSLFSQWKE